jgi:hypothetical protein
MMGTTDWIENNLLQSKEAKKETEEKTRSTEALASTLPIQRFRLDVSTI